jgi:hypothetical protein
MDELVTQNGINPKDYTDLFPISVFDVGRHSEKLMASAVDIQIKCFFQFCSSLMIDWWCLCHGNKMSDCRLYIKLFYDFIT